MNLKEKLSHACTDNRKACKIPAHLPVFQTLDEAFCLLGKGGLIEFLASTPSDKLSVAQCARMALRRYTQPPTA